MSSAYGAMFFISSELLGARQLWKIKAPSEHKFFAWLVLQDRCWTFDRRHWHGLQADITCALCDKNPDLISHFLGCVYNCEVWASFLHSCGWGQLVLMADSSFTDWWIASCKPVTKRRRKAFDSIIFLVSRCIWLQQNSSVFDP
jgi:hypothetical protein